MKENTRKKTNRRAGLGNVGVAVDKRTLDQKVYMELRDAIMGGAFVPGQVLTLRGLAAELGTSLMPIRNAVSRLTVEQALDATPNRSIMLPELNVEEYDEMTEIRVSLESLATRIATGCISDAQLEHLEQLDDEMGSANPSHYFQLNRKFHFSLYEIARKPVLYRMIQSAWLRTGPLLNSLESERTKLATVTHDWTIAALKRRDSEDAAASIAADIRSAAHVLRALIAH